MYIEWTLLPFCEMGPTFTILTRVLCRAHFYHFNSNWPNFYPTLGLCATCTAVRGSASGQRRIGEFKHQGARALPRATHDESGASFCAHSAPSKTTPMGRKMCARAAARVSALHEHRFVVVGFAGACPSGALLGALGLAAPAHLMVDGRGGRERLMADGRLPRWMSSRTGRRSPPTTIAPGADWVDRAPCPVAVEVESEDSEVGSTEPPAGW